MYKVKSHYFPLISIGTVTLWSPNVKTPLVKMLCHRGPVKALAVDQGGWYNCKLIISTIAQDISLIPHLCSRYLVTAALDNQFKIWDIRTYKQLEAYYINRPAATLAISQRGLLATGCGPHVQVCKTVFFSTVSASFVAYFFILLCCTDLEGPF